MGRDNTEKTLLEEIFDRARRGNKEALHELEAFADNKDAEALSKLAEIYLKGLGGTEQCKDMQTRKTSERLFSSSAIIFTAGVIKTLRRCIGSSNIKKEYRLSSCATC